MRAAWGGSAVVAAVACAGPSEVARPAAVADAATEAPDSGASGGGSTPTTPSEDPCAADAPDPGPPSRSDTIRTLTVTVETGPDVFNGTDDATIALCLAADVCVSLADPTVEQLASGAVGVWMFEGLDLPRSAVDRVSLQVTDGSNQWRPVQMDLRFDGEPVYCASLDVPIGTEAGESPSWQDPLGLHQDCTSAWDRRLTHGPLLGAVTDGDARLWLRTDATRAVSVRVWPSDDPTAARVADWAYPRAEDDFAAVLELGCLSADTRYTYEVLVDGEPQFPGAFRTAPARGAAGAFHLAFGSCAKDDAQPIFADILARGPDLFAFVGDNHYANSSDLDVLRWYYRWSLERPERAALVAAVPTLATWDDHDFVGNNTWGDAPGKEQALRAFKEYWANPSYGLPEAPGVYFSHPRGDVDLFVLDDRYWRGVEGSLLGTVQHDWLVRALAESTATFKLVIDGSQWSFTGAEDSWDEFPDERDALFQSIADLGVTGVALLSGDIHRSELRILDAPAYDLPEITSSALANTSGSGCGALGGELLACAAETQYWIEVSIDTALADPTLTATIYEVGGIPRASHQWTLSALGG
jgi:alkaline phosphatase D